MKNRRFGLRLGLPASLALAVVLTGAAALLCLWIQPNSLRAVLAVLRAQPLLLVLNCLPIGLLIVAFSFWLGSVFAAAGVVGVCCALLSLANRIKLEVRDEPVFPRDLTLLKEAGSAMGAYAIRWPWGVVVVIVCFALAMALGALLVGHRPLPRTALPRWALRALAGAASLGALIALLFTLYASDSLYSSFSVSNPYYVPAVFNELGFPYCFCHHFTAYTVDRPDGFSRAQAEAWEAEETVSGEGKAVNVIFVMNEAFSDLTDFDAFTYSEEDDPLQNFHAMRAGSHCLSGRVVVPGFAGGTANTEFDVLTGMQTNALSSNTTSSFRAVNRNLDSLFRVFGADGYATQFLHPGDNWFYNRENVYRWLGAQDIAFARDMEGLSSKGRWVTDASMAQQIEDRFAAAASAGTPLFNCTVTIQNHMSYTADKYGADYVFAPVQTSASLSEEARTMLSVYIEGVRDADAMLGELRDYFSARQEPVVLVFWGDHLPALGDERMVYRELGYDLSPESDGTESFLRSFETPYVIWANDAAAETLDWDAAAAALELPADGTISACYLGGMVLELTGRADESPWFRYLAQLRRELPVLQRKTYVTADGAVTTDLTARQQSLVDRLRQWSYYKLKYKDVD